MTVGGWDALAVLIRSTTDTWDEPLDEVHDVPQIVNAILGSEWLAARDRRVAAQTLRDAADDAVNLWQNTGGGGDIRETVAAVARWLTDRADTHEKEQP